MSISLGLSAAKETAIASAATTNLGSVPTLKAEITGTTTITSFGTGANLLKFIRFSGALLLTHHATSLILPGGTSIPTAAGDTAIAMSDASGNWRVYSYVRAGRKGSLILGQGATAAALTGSTAETVLASVSIPAGWMVAGSLLRVTALWSFVNATANNKFAIVRLGGLAGDAYHNNNFSAVLSLETVTNIFARSLTSQIGKYAGLGQAGGSSSAANKTSAVNLANAQTLVISGQLANSTDTITLESYSVELITP